MKNINFKIALVFAITVTAISAEAQLKFGIRGGLNASTVSFPNLPNKSEKISFHIGGFTDIPISDNFMSIQPELSYSSKGTMFKVLNQKQSINMNYVDLLVPVSFKMNAFSLNVGPYVSYLISSPDYIYYNDNSVLVDGFKKIDAGLTAGLNYNFNKMLFGLRFNQGLIDVTENNTRTLLGSGKNAVGQVSVGFKF
jgi:hypothetical protein